MTVKWYVLLYPAHTEEPPSYTGTKEVQTAIFEAANFRENAVMQSLCE